MGTKEK